MITLRSKRSKVKTSKANSIWKKLTQVFLVVLVVVFLLNAFIYYNLNHTLSQVDNVYSSNIRLNDLSENLQGIQDQLYEYLSSQSSDVLESYYTYEQDYRNKLKELSQEVVSDSYLLMEKNIYNLSQTYLQETNDAINAKRGRDVSKYKEAYEKSEKLYDYLQAGIDSMNTTSFLENAHNYSVLRESLTVIMISSIVALFVVMILSMVWVITMTRSITKPLVRLAAAATEIAAGNIEVDFPIVETGDEITAVAKACNKMIESIRSHIEETKANMERESRLKENELTMKSDLKEAQLKYLQAQINPHFLFNSLNAGAQLAMMEGAEKACMFIENMADFFRYNVRKLGNDSTLREELQLIDSYIYILNVRFSGEIRYQKQIDERCLDTLMPGMILQPIVENAVNHGLRDGDGGELLLCVYGDRDEVRISVRDNGRGVDPEVAQQIMTGGYKGSGYQKDSAGVGLDNVISRLRSYYNKEEVFTITPLAKGTEVMVIIPIEREGGNDDKNSNLR